MAYLWLATAQSLQHVALMTNAGIHVLMYYYYFMCSIKRPPRWKRLVTSSQIVQFVFRRARGCRHAPQWTHAAAGDRWHLWGTCTAPVTRSHSCTSAVKMGRVDVCCGCSFAISVPFWWLHFTRGGCAGFSAMVFNAVFNFLLLGLFIDFHRRTFQAKAVRRPKKQE